MTTISAGRASAFAERAHSYKVPRRRSAMGRALCDPDVRALLMILTIAGIAALIATAVKAIT